MKVEAVTLDTQARARARGTTAADRRGALLIEAAAGTGKTTVLVDRVLAYVEAGERRVREIAIVTFTELAAAQLRVRLRDELAKALASAAGGAHGASAADARAARLREGLADLETAAVGTIHGFCFDLLRQAPIEAGLDPTFGVADPFAARLLLLEAWEELLRDLGNDEPGLLAAEDLELLREPALRQVAFALVGLDSAQLPRPLEATDLAFEERFARIGSLLHAAHAAAFRGASLAKNLEEMLASYDELVPLQPREQQSAFVLSKWKPRGNLGRAGEAAAKEYRDAAAADLEALRTDLRHQRITELTAWLHGLAARYHAKTVMHGTRLDFDQLISCALDLVRAQPHVLARFRSAYPVVMVDEFQDTDRKQTELLLLLAGGGREGDCFFVGDPKQSIYRFRGADLENYRRVRAEVFGAGRCAQLAQNFRCVPELATWINATLGFILGNGEQPWEAAYGPLSVAAPRVLPAPRGVVRLRLRPLPGASVAAVRIHEAEALAGVVERLLAEGARVRDPETGRLRGARHGDIALLLRKLTAVDAYERAFARRGIPAAVVGGRHYYRRDEVHVLTQILRAIADPGDPVATVAALRGPGFGCSDHDLLAYALAGDRAPRFDSAAVLPPQALAGSPDPAAAAVVAAAIRRLRALRREVVALPLPDLVSTVLDRLGLYVFFALGPRGEQRVANLAKAVEIARRLEGAETTPLSAFVRWLEALLDGAPEEPDSQYLEMAGDSVRILSIHAAKGLEFPIVLLGGLASGEEGPSGMQIYGAQTPEETGTVAIRLKSELGTRGWRDVRAREAEREAAEEKRLLYVAVTRARDYLVVPQAANELVPEKWTAMLFRSLRLAQSKVGDAGAVALDVADLPAPQEERAQQFDLGRLVAGLPTSAGDRRVRWAQGQRHGTLPTVLRPSDPQVAVANATAKPLVARAPVANGEVPIESHAGTLGRAAAARAARVGKVAHASLAAALRDQPPPVLDVLSSAERQSVTEYVARFMASPLAVRAKAAGELLIEEHLAIALEPGSVLDAQLDLAFREPAGWVLVDYKTDRVDAATLPAAADGYRGQLRWYAAALQALTSTPVIEAHLFFLRLGRSVRVEIDDRDRSRGAMP